MSSVYIIVLFSTFFWGSLAENNPRLQIKQDGTYSLKPDRLSAIILSLVLMLVSAFRYRVGTDYMAYFRWTVPRWEQVWDNFIHFREPAFSLLAFLSRKIFNHGQSLIFLSAVITIGLYCLTIYRYHASYLLSILFFIFMGTWQTSFNGIRQSIAAAILFAGHRFILDRKFWQYCLVVFIASMFHATAVIMIIPYFVFSRQADITQIILLAAGAIIIRFSYGVIFSLIGSYKGRVMDLQGDAYLTNSVSIFRVLVAFIPVIIYFFLCRKTNLTKEQTLYINAALFNAFSMLAGMGSTYFGRIGVYTGSLVCLGYGYLFQLIDDERTRNLIKYIILAVYLIYWIYSIQAGGISTFRWIFDNV